MKRFKVGEIVKTNCPIPTCWCKGLMAKVVRISEKNDEDTTTYRLYFCDELNSEFYYEKDILPTNDRERFLYYTHGYNALKMELRNEAVGKNS